MDPAVPSRRTFLSALAAGSTAALAGCAIPGEQASERETRTIDPAGDTPLVVDNVNGGVTVTGDSTDTIELEIIRRTNFGRDLLEDATVTVDTDDERILVQGRTEGLPVGASVSIELRVSLPDGVPVQSATTRNGDVTVRDATGDATLETTNGRVTAERVAGYLTLRTSNGSVDATDVDGIDRAETSNGSVDVEVPAIRQDTRVESTNGSVTMRVATDLDVDIELQTTNGDVSYSGLDLSVSSESDTRLRGTLGSGGSRLVGETTNGDVRLRALD